MRPEGQDSHGMFWRSEPVGTGAADMAKSRFKAFTLLKRSSADGDSGSPTLETGYLEKPPDYHPQVLVLSPVSPWTTVQ